MNENLIRENASACYDGELALESLPAGIRQSAEFNEAFNDYHFIHATLAELPVLEPTKDLKERVFKKMGTATVTSIPVKKSATKPSGFHFAWRMAAVIVLGAALLAAYALFNNTNRKALARIVSIDGAVRIVESPEKERVAALDAEINEGDRVLTAPGAMVEMAFTSGVHATLQSDSALKVESLEKARLEYGTARIETTESAFTIETRHGRIETDKGSADITVNDVETQVKCLSGKVRVRSDGEDINLSTGESHILGRSQQTSRVERRTPAVFSSPSTNVAAGPSGAISGILTDPDGKPVSGASLELFKYTPYLDEYVIFAGPNILDRTTTNGDGYYAFGQLPAGEYRIVVKSRDYAPDEIARVVIDENEVAGGVNWKLKPAVPITIRTVDEAHQPVPNVQITTWAVRESDFLFFVQEDLTTNDAGECVVNIAADMKGEARAFPEDYILAETQISPNSATAELVLRKGHSIRGAALDETGQPFSGATVLAQEITSANNNYIRTRCMKRTRTNNNGEFSLSHLPDGKFYVLVQSEGYELGESQAVEIAGQDVEGLIINLVPGPAVQGQVIDAYGQSVEGAIVAVEPVPPAPDGESRPIFCTDMRFGDEVPVVVTRSDKTGHFTFPPVQKGVLRVMALVPDSSVPLGARVEIDSITGPLRLKLEPKPGDQQSTKIKGIVLTAEGIPAFPAYVNAQISEKSENGGRSYGSRSLVDQKGRFTLLVRSGHIDFGHGTSVSYSDSNLPSPSETMVFKVTARTPEGLTGNIEYEGPQNAGKDDLVIHLSEGGVIAGMVRDCSGFPVSGADVIARPASREAGSSRMYKSLDTRTDEQGRFRIRGLEADVQYTIASTKFRHGMGYITPVTPGTSDVLIKLLPGAYVRGKVLDPDGKPLPEVSVSAMASGLIPDQMIFDILYEFPHRPAITTGRNGEFELPIRTFKGCAEWSLSAKDCRNVIVTALPGSLVEGIVIQKASGASIAGRVIDNETKQPIAKAVVIKGLNDNLTETNDKGEFLITGLPPGLIQITFRAEGYTQTGNKPNLDLDIKGGEEIKDIVIELAREGVIEGIVVDQDNRPLENAQIHVWEDYGFGSTWVITSQSNSSRNIYKSSTNITGKDGKFTLHGVPRGYKARFTVTLDKYVQQDCNSIQEITAPMEPASEPVRIVLVKTAIVSGSVQDINGKPIQEGRVRIYQITDENSRSYSHAEITNGQFSSDREPGSYYVESDVAGYAATRTVEFDVAPGETHAGADLRLRPLKEGEGNYLILRFDMGNNKAERGQYVEVHVSGRDWYDSRSVVEWNLKQPLQMEVGNTSVKSVTITTEFPGLPTVTLTEVPVPSKDVVIKAVASGRITGRVVDAETGQPITKFAAMLPLSGRNGGGNREIWQTFTAGELDFNKDIGDRAATLHIVAPGYIAREIKDILCKAGEETSIGEIRLEKGVLLTGDVEDVNGKPVEGARVSPKFPGNSAAPDWSSVKTDSQGRFELGGFTPGITRISVTHKEYASQWNAKVVIEPGKSRQETRIVMTQGGSVEGVVYDAEGKPVAGASVYGAGESCQTDREGRFRADLVPPGEINIWASGTNLRDYRSASLNIEEGQVIQVEIRPGQNGTKEIGRTPISE